MVALSVKNSKFFVIEVYFELELILITFCRLVLQNWLKYAL